MNWHRTSDRAAAWIEGNPIARLAWRERWWLIALAALVTFCRIPTVDGWDESFYVGQLTSVLGDRDLRLQDDAILVPERLMEQYRVVTTTLPSGALANTFSVGPAVLDAPFAWPTVSSSSPPPWIPFRAAAAVAAMTMLLLTALLTARVVERLGVTPDVARLAAGLAILTGPLAVYGTRAYLNAHLGGALLVALALHQGLLWLESCRLTNAIAMGLACGLACVNRWQDVVIVGPLALAVLASRVEGRGRAVVLVGGGAILAGSIQLLAWQVQFGTPFLVPQGAGYMHWLHPQLVALLFSSYHGLVPWNPGFALGLVGLGLLALGRWGPPARLRLPLAALAVGAGLTLYVSACPEDWWGRDSFGPRRLTSLVAPVALGLGVLLERLRPVTRYLVAGLLGLWSVVAVSAHFSRWEDLGLLLVGRLGPFQPDGVVAVPSDGWVNRWGALHFLKPGFSLSDAPRLPDRVIGIVVVVAVVSALRVLWPLFTERRAVQRTAVAVGVAYLCLWNVVLATMPGNREWDAKWRDFLTAPLDEMRAATLAPEMALPRDVVIAVRAAEAGDHAAMEAAIARLRGAGVVVTEASLVAAVAGAHSP